MKLIILGDPIPKMRPRFARRGNKSFVYDAQSAECKYIKKKFCTQLERVLNSACKAEVMGASALANATAFVMDIALFFSVPKSDSERVRNLKLWGVIEHTTKPDATNCYKFYEDCANTVLYHDDAAIVRGSFSKQYDLNPRTEINIMACKAIKNNAEVELVLELFDPKSLLELNDDIITLASDTVQYKINMDIDYDLKQISAFCKRLIYFAEKHAKTLKKIESKSAKASGEGKILC